MVCGYVKQLFIEDIAREVTLEVSENCFLDFLAGFLLGLIIVLRVLFCARMVRN